MFQPEWTQFSANDPKYGLQSSMPTFAIQAPSVQQSMGMPTFSNWDPSGYTTAPELEQFAPWADVSMQNVYNDGIVSDMEYDYNQIVSVQT